MKPLKVSELARRAGVSIRTLHYYEEVGLIEPTRTESGHRRYGRTAVQRLLQIRSLQQLGFSLSQIDALFRRRIGPKKIVADHLAAIQVQREALARLEAQLEQLHLLLQHKKTNNAEAVEVILQTLEAMTMYEKHLAPEQLQQSKALHGAAGAATAAKWHDALAALRVEMNAGTDPTDPKVKEIAERWHDAASAFIPADDAAAHEAMMKLLHDEPQARQDHGLDDALFSYLGRVLAPDEHS